MMEILQKKQNRLEFCKRFMYNIANMFLTCPRGSERNREKEIERKTSKTSAGACFVFL